MSTHAYIGRKRCGCAVAIVMDEPQWPKDTAKSVRDFIARGYTVERLPPEDAVAALKQCACGPQQDALFECARCGKRTDAESLHTCTPRATEEVG